MEYKITQVQERSQWGPAHGHMMQEYAIALERQEGWHKLNQRVETPAPRIGDTIHGVIEDKQYGDGTPYKKFTKQNPKYDGANRTNDPSRIDAGTPKLEYIILMLEELTGRRGDGVDQRSETTTSSPQEESLNLDDIPF